MVKQKGVFIRFSEKNRDQLMKEKKDDESMQVFVMRRIEKNKFDEKLKRLFAEQDARRKKRRAKKK